METVLQDRFDELTKPLQIEAVCDPPVCAAGPLMTGLGPEFEFTVNATAGLSKDAHGVLVLWHHCKETTNVTVTMTFKLSFYDPMVVNYRTLCQRPGLANALPWLWFR